MILLFRSTMAAATMARGQIRGVSTNRPGKRSRVIEESDLPRVRRTSRWKVGAHVSAAGGVENAVTNASAIGANSFALFLKSQRKWTSPALKASSITAFKDHMKELGYSPDHVLPHGSYLINLGNPDAEKRQKSYDCFLDDLLRVEQLGLLLYNFHPGSTVGEATIPESIAFIANAINDAHKATNTAVTVIENMAGAGNIIGGDFSHLGDIIKQVEDKSRVGVCLDTCHMFAAGYDIRSAEGWNATMKTFEEQIGLQYLRGIHLNDSKTVLNSKRDRHDNIGIGYIGLAAFHHVLTDPRCQDIPIILETPTNEKSEVWAVEIDVLNDLSTMESCTPGEIEQLKNKIRDAVKSSESAKPKRPAKKPRKTRNATEDEDE